MHALIERVEHSLADVVPAEPVEIRGSWSRSTRRTYEQESQVGSGAGPFRDVVDVFWGAVVTWAQPLAGIGFVRRRESLYWVKSPPATMNLALHVSLHAYTSYLPGQATFCAGIGNSVLPGVPVRCGPELEAACVMGRAIAQTGRAHLVAEVDGTAFVVLLIPGALVKTGRNRLWHLRDALAAELPDDVRELLTRGRSGSLHD